MVLGLVVVFFFVLPGLHFCLRQIRENKIIDAYIAKNGLSGLPLNKATAIRVSEEVRRDFNTKESDFKRLDMAHRSFLREDVATLLEAREGFCGEGTRVIVRILGRLGFNATRVTLYNKKLRSAHTLVSVLQGDQEYFVDSIRTSEKFSNFLKLHDISANHFNLLRYSDKTDVRRSLASQKQNDQKEAVLRGFTDRFWVYSYEALPFSKIANRVGLTVRVFNFKRPGELLSQLAEEPNMLKAIGCFGGALFLALLVSVVFADELRVPLNTMQDVEISEETQLSLRQNTDRAVAAANTADARK